MGRGGAPMTLDPTTEARVRAKRDAPLDQDADAREFFPTVSSEAITQGEAAIAKAKGQP